MPEEKSRFTRFVLPAVVLIALAIVGVYAFVWLQSDAGARQFESLKTAWGKYNPVALLTGQYDEAKRTVSWTSDTNSTAKKQGIILNAFSALSKKMAPGGEVVLKYDMTINIPQTYTVPTDFYCKVSSTGVEGEIIPPNPVRITSTSKPSVRCKLSGETTDTLSGPVRIDGGLTFPYTTKDVKLPVYFARPDIAEDFFNKYGIEERNPIKAQYNEEPVELAIGVSDDNMQPVIVEEAGFPMIGIAAHNRWGGKVKEVTSLEMTLPEGAAINQELSKSPSITCPFEFVRTEKGKNLYRASGSVLQSITFLQTTQTFECWLTLDPEIIPQDADYSKKEYTAAISYVYETAPKSDVVTFE